MNLTIRHISAAYRKKPIVEDVSFSVSSSSITALTGRNGAGKSTLISCLMGEKRDYTGEILLGGQNVRALSPIDRARNMACLPQELPAPHVQVRELVSFGRTPFLPLNGKLTPNDKEKVDWALSVTGMGQFEDNFVDTLSGGERKKAFFAMTLAQDTPLVILDEPTAHLDSASRFQFLELMDTVRRETGKTFLVVMHDLPEALLCADQLVTLHDHKLVFSGSGSDFLASTIPQVCFHIALRGNREDGYAVTPLHTPPQI